MTYAVAYPKSALPSSCNDASSTGGIMSIWPTKVGNAATTAGYIAGTTVAVISVGIYCFIGCFSSYATCVLAAYRIAVVCVARGLRIHREKSLGC